MADTFLHPPFLPLPPAAATNTFGFRFGVGGGHASRTLMLSELSILMSATVGGVPAADDWRRLCVDDNILGKPTLHTRGATLQRLREMHGLDDSLTLFRGFRQLWQADELGRPLLAMILALCRDPIFRVSTPVILRSTPGEPVSRERFTSVFSAEYAGQYKESMIDKLVRHVASSWCQTGHLKGRVLKSRQKVTPTPAVVAYALLAAYLLGLRGQALFHTTLARLLDAEQPALLTLAREARRLGYLELRESADVLEISFPRLLTSDETLLSHGQS